jgi:hypothetical protein
MYQMWPVQAVLIVFCSAFLYVGHQKTAEPWADQQFLGFHAAGPTRKVTCAGDRYGDTRTSPFVF